MVLEVIQLEEISWRLWREKGKCYIFIRAQSRAAQLQWLLIHCSLEVHTFLKICRRFSRILGEQLACWHWSTTAQILDSHILSGYLIIFALQRQPHFPVSQFGSVKQRCS